VKFTSAAANALQAELNASAEPPRLATARRLIAQAQPGTQRREVAAKLLEEVGEAEFQAVWEMAREAEADETEETSPRPPDRLERERAERDEQRRAIEAAGAEATLHVGDNRYRIADVSVDELSADGRRVFEHGVNLGVGEVESFRLARQYESEYGGVG
jgi:hypothetical protein